MKCIPMKDYLYYAPAETSWNKSNPKFEITALKKIILKGNFKKAFDPEIPSTLATKNCVVGLAVAVPNMGHCDKVLSHFYKIKVVRLKFAIIFVNYLWLCFIIVNKNVKKLYKTICVTPIFLNWFLAKIIMWGNIFTELSPLGQFSHRVTMSIGLFVCLFFCLSVCAIGCIFTESDHKKDK